MDKGEDARVLLSGFIYSVSTATVVLQPLYGTTSVSRHQCLIILSLLCYKYSSKYLLCKQLQAERTGVESWNLLNCDFNCRLTNPLSDTAIGQRVARPAAVITTPLS